MFTTHQGPPRHRRALAGAATIAAMTVTLVACSADDPDGNGNGDGNSAPAPDAGPAAFEDFPGATAGAMEDFGVGTSFVATEPVEFGLFYRDHPNYPIEDDWRILTALEEFNNVSFDIVSAPLSEWDDRKAVVIGGGDAPDIISVTYPGQEVQFVAGRAILPASEWVQWMPNYLDKVEKWGLSEELDQLRQEDGHYYLFPGLREAPRPQYTFAVRTDIWEELGLSLEPATFDEFADQLRTVKEAYPDVTPYFDRWSNPSNGGVVAATMNMAAPSFGTSAGWGYGEGVTYDDAAGEFVYTGATDEYRALVEWFAALVDEGIMNPESFTSENDDAAIAAFGAGNSFVIGTNDQELLRIRETFEELGSDAEVGMIRVPGGPAGEVLPAGGRLVSGFMLGASSADHPNFLAMLQFLDWLYYSDEGLEFAKWGVEGETFTKDADGVRTLADNIDINGLNPGAPESLNVDYGFHNGVWMLEHGSTLDLDLSMLRPEVQDFVLNMNESKTQLELPPPWPLTELERETASIQQAGLSDHVFANTALFITGQRSLDEWDAYVAELEAQGLATYMQVVNEARERAAE